MLKNVDYVIVGDGYAAMFLAHHLIKNQKSFILFSASARSASQISAGVINPVVLKKFTTFWLAEEQIKFLHKTLAEIELYTGRNYLIQENIHRIFHDEKEKELWLSKTETGELVPFLNPLFDRLNTVKNPFGTGIVNQSARLDVEAFFGGFKTFFQKNGFLRQEKFNYDQLHGNIYNDIHFKNIVFCEGMGVRQNPFFSAIPVIPNKGHHFKVKLAKPLEYKYTLKKKHFLFPVKDNLYYYGGTYDPNERDQVIDDFKVEELKAGLQEFYPENFEIAEINFGFRPTVKDRRPILGNHPQHSTYYVFNGLGARGILNGCYFAEELFNHIEQGKVLMEEVDVKRFNILK